MKKPEPAFTIPPEIAARYTEPDQFERFDAAVSKVLSVPRSVILAREAEYKRRSALNPNRRGPKRKDTQTNNYRQKNTTSPVR